MTPSDAELLTQWRSGDTDAGTELFERYYAPILRFFRNKISEGVADLVQETFAACLAGRDKLRADTSFRSYLFAIAHHVLRRHLRAKHRAGGQLDLDQVTLRALVPGPGSLVARHHEERLLLEALRSIPLTYQVILELRYWEDLKTREIADVLGVPHPTARSQLRRAHELLEAAMAELACSSRELKSTLANLDDWAASCRQGLAELL